MGRAERNDNLINSALHGHRAVLAKDVVAHRRLEPGVVAQFGHPRTDSAGSARSLGRWARGRRDRDRQCRERRLDGPGVTRRSRDSPAHGGQQRPSGDQPTASLV